MASGAKITDAPPLAVHEVRFEGGILQRGFWLYVCEVTPADRTPLYQVGRTGDSSSTYAQAPFNRIGQHLGFAKNSNMLRRHLTQHGAVPEASLAGATATDGSLVAIPESFRPDSTTPVGRLTLQQARLRIQE